MKSLWARVQPHLVDIPNYIWLCGLAVLFLFFICAGLRAIFLPVNWPAPTHSGHVKLTDPDTNGYIENKGLYTSDDVELTFRNKSKLSITDVDVTLIEYFKATRATVELPINLTGDPAPPGTTTTFTGLPNGSAGTTPACAPEATCTYTIDDAFAKPVAR